MNDPVAWLALWLLGCATVGYVAQTKGRNTIGWFLLALLASPVLVGIVILLMPPNRREARTP